MSLLWKLQGKTIFLLIIINCEIVLYNELFWYLFGLKNTGWDLMCNKTALYGLSSTIILVGFLAVKHSGMPRVFM